MNVGVYSVDAGMYVQVWMLGLLPRLPFWSR